MELTAPVHDPCRGEETLALGVNPGSVADKTELAGVAEEGSRVESDELFEQLGRRNDPASFFKTSVGFKSLESQMFWPVLFFNNSVV